MSVVYMDRESAWALTDKDVLRLIKEQSREVTRYQTLIDYYKGKHKILNHSKKDPSQPNNKVVCNGAKYITDTAVGYFVGMPVIYSSADESFMEAITGIYEYNDEQDQNTELAKSCSIYGSAFEMMYMDENGKIRMARVSPENMIMIYDMDGITAVSAVRLMNSINAEGKVIKKAEYWTWNEVKTYKIDNSKAEFMGAEANNWDDIPFVEYINNEERTGDFEGVVSIIDAYNKVQSNTANMFEYNDNAILKVSKFGDVTTDEIAQMKDGGAVILEDGGDIDWAIKNIQDAALENYKKRLREDMHLFSNIPNMSDDSFGGNNLSGVAVSYKLWGLEQVCAIKERKFKRGLQRRIELITNMLNLQGGNYSYMDIEMTFRRNKPQNILEIAQIMTMLSSELSQETRLKMLPIIEDVQSEIDKLEDEKAKDAELFGGGNTDMRAFVKGLGEE